MQFALLLAIFVLLSFSPTYAFADGGDESSDTPPPAACTLQAQYPKGDVRNCPTHSPQDEAQPLYRMEVLPGMGFDNLRNLDMGQVHQYNYSTCKISNGGGYLLPDNIFLVPIQESHVDVFAEYFENWDDYTSMTSASINIDASFFSVVSGKFSIGYMSTKTHQVNDRSKTTRVQIRHKLFVVKIQPDAQLHPTFKARLFDIAANLQNNNTVYAEYLAELLVRDYGTHYITTIDAGALLSQVDHISSTYALDQYATSTKITASASANFFGKVSFGASFSYSTSEQDTDAFISNRTHSEVFTIGGPPFRPNFTINEWEDGVPNALVAIDRAGDPLHFVINPTTIAELPEVTVRQVAQIVYRAINRYYKVNTRHGCTDMESPNFDFQANIGDGSCEPINTNFTFGGVYQTCQVDPELNTEDLCTAGPEPAAQVNPLTGTYSCPENYTAIRLHSGTITHVIQKPVCNNVCHHCGFLGWGRCCECQSVLTPFLSAANYQAYWCAAAGEVEDNNGYLFGGFYTSTTSNPMTGSMTCPRYFIPLHFGEDIEVCVSDDYELGYAYSVPFGGFESCQAGNPLAASQKFINESSKWPHACPSGYAQHLVTVDEGCEINFCIQAGAFNPQSLLPAKLPPFRKHPSYKKNVTDALVVFGIYGEIWSKQADGLWKLVDNGSPDGLALLETFEAAANSGEEIPTSGTDNKGSNGDGDSLSAGAVAGISIVATLALCTIIVVVFFAGFTIAKRKKKPKDDSYVPINEGGSTGETKI